MQKECQFDNKSIWRPFLRVKWDKRFKNVEEGSPMNEWQQYRVAPSLQKTPGARHHQ